MQFISGSIFFAILLTGCATRTTRGMHAVGNVVTDGFVSTVSVIEKSICPIVCIAVGQDNTATLNSIEGTGFFISQDGAFVTARHVIDAIVGPRQPPTKPCPLSAIYLPTDGWGHENRRWFAFRPGECLTIRDFDIARCRSVARITVEFTPVRFEDSEQRAATAVAFTGFPLQSLDPITSRGYIAAYTSQVAGLGKTEMLIDRTAWPGDSGSPVYLEDGRVIGMVQKRGTGNAEGIAFVRPTRFIQRLLATRQ